MRLSLTLAVLAVCLSTSLAGPVVRRLSIADASATFGIVYVSTGGQANAYVTVKDANVALSYFYLDIPNSRAEEHNFDTTNGLVATPSAVIPYVHQTGILAKTGAAPSGASHTNLATTASSAPFVARVTIGGTDFLLVGVLDGPAPEEAWTGDNGCSSEPRYASCTPGKGCVAYLTGWCSDACEWQRVDSEEAGTITYPNGNAQAVSLVKIEGTCDASVKFQLMTTSGRTGLTAACVQTVLIVDNLAPEIHGVPESYEDVDCDSQVPQPLTAYATDNCDASPQLTYKEEQQDGKLVRTWTAKDSTGRTSTKVRSIVVSDSTPPTLLNGPGGETVQCDSVPAPCAVSANDLCAPCAESGTCDVAQGGSLPVTYTQTRSDRDCAFNYTLTRRWRATDFSGLSAAHTQVITVEDSEAPIFTSTFDNANVATYNCGEVPGAPTMKAQDNCQNEAVDVHFSEAKYAVNGQQCKQLLVRTWTAKDNCDNDATAVQSLFIVDTSPPIIHLNEPQTGGEPRHDPNDAPCEISAYDGCDNDVSHSFTLARVNGTCKANFDMVTTWTAVDWCGLEAEEKLTSQFRDNTPPSFRFVSHDAAAGVDSATTTINNAVPAGGQTLQLTCVDSGTHHLTAVDLAVADTSAWASMTDESFGSECHPTRYREWSAEDECGNTATTTQTLVYSDPTDPYFEVLEYQDQRTTCASHSISVTASAKVVDGATDDCEGKKDVTYTQVLNSDNSCNQTVVHSYAAEFCIKDISHSWTVYHEDAQEPTFENMPSSAVAVETGNTASETALTDMVAAVGAVDTCQSAVDLTHTSADTDIDPSDACSDFDRVFTFMADDGCKPATGSFTAQFRDTTPPSVTAPTKRQAVCGAAPTTLSRRTLPSPEASM